MKRFLVYSLPRCGSTKMIYDLEARLPAPFQTVNEPANGSLEERIRFGSTYAYSGTRKLRKWLDSNPLVRGIKMLAVFDGEESQGAWVEDNLDAFDSIVVLERDPVDVCVSWEIAKRSGNWNILDQTDQQRDSKMVLSEFHVSAVTVDRVRLGIESCRRVEAACPEKVMKVEFPGILEDIRPVLKFIGLGEKPVREPRFEVRPVSNRAGAASRKCLNLDHLMRYFGKSCE